MNVPHSVVLISQNVRRHLAFFCTDEGAHFLMFLSLAFFW